MVQFRDIKADPQAAGDRGIKKKSKLSFVELAGDPEKSGKANLRSAPDESRKLLYEEALDYLNQALGAVRNRQRFSLEKGLQIIRNFVEMDPS